MNKLIKRLALASALAAVLCSTTWLPAAEAEKAPKQQKAAAEKKAPAQPRGTTYRGTIAAVDTTAMTLTITNKSSTRVFQITSQTRFFKKEKPAILAELVIGDVVGGSYLKDGEKLNLLTVRDSGPDEKAARQAEKPDAKAGKQQARKAEKKAAKKPDQP
jgi:hypothetical protein